MKDVLFTWVCVIRSRSIFHSRYDHQPDQEGSVSISCHSDPLQEFLARVKSVRIKLWLNIVLLYYPLEGVMNNKFQKARLAFFYYLSLKILIASSHDGLDMVLWCIKLLFSVDTSNKGPVHVGINWLSYQLLGWFCFSQLQRKWCYCRLFEWTVVKAMS